jgi:hypothetical protein
VVTSIEHIPILLQRAPQRIHKNQNWLYDSINMDEKSAREYVTALLATIKQTRTKRHELEKKVALWKKRVALAEEKNEPKLSADASVILDQKKHDLSHLIAEEKELVKELRSAKSQLVLLQSRPELSINPDQLLAELEMVADKEDETTSHFKDFEAEQALEALKKKIEENQD